MTEYQSLFERREGLLGSEAVMNRRYDAALGLLLGSIKALAFDFTFDKTLDVGCADGRFTRRLATVSEAVWGIDVSQKEIERAKVNCPRGSFSVGNANDLLFPDSFFNLVSCLDTIYYLDRANRMKAIDEFARVLKPNGYLLISTSWPRFTKTRTGQSYIKPKALRALLGDRFEFINEATTSTMHGLPFLRSGCAMLFRKK